MRTSTPAPPRAAIWLLRTLLGADDFESAAGDLAEGFIERASSRGTVRARAWYWRETAAFLARAALRVPRGFGGPPAFIRDFRFGVRALRRQPGFALAAVAVMALGVGAATAVYSVLRGVLLSPLPYHNAGELVVFRAVLPGGSPMAELTSAEFHALRARTDLFTSVAAVVRADGNLTAPHIMAPVNVAAVSADFLETVGVRPVIGTSVARATSGRPRPVNISHDVWLRHFGGRPDVAGETIEVNGTAMTVAGVLPRGFTAYFGSGTALPTRVDLLTFRGTGYDEDPSRGNIVVARVRRDVPLATVQAALDVVARNVVAANADRYRTGPVRLSAGRLHDAVVAGARPALLAAAGAVLLVLLASCANLANLLLVRASTRTREISVRMSVGAARGDILRQLLAESVLIGGSGALVGWLLARWAVSAMLALAPEALPRREAVAADGGVAAFAIGLGVTCAMLVSLIPAWRASRRGLSERMKRALPEGSARGMLVAAQLALSVILLVGAALLGRAFVKMRMVPLGFEPHGAASLFVGLDGQRWDGGTIQAARVLRRGFYERAADQARQLPGVQHAAAGFPVPLSGIVMPQRIARESGAVERETDGFIAFEGYLEALQVPLIEGRYFSRADHARPTVMVDERLARELWPTESAVGQRLLIIRSVSEPLWADIVGVVAHVRARGVRDAGPPQVWMTYSVRAYAQLNMVVRAYAQLNMVVRAGAPLDAAGQIAGVVRQMGAGRPSRDVRLLADYAAEATAETRFALFVVAILAVLAGSLAAVGVYGVVSSVVARRRRDLAVRLALGANPRTLAIRLTAETGRWVAAGVVAGVGGAAALARLLETLLFEVSAYDPLTFVAVPGLLAATALVASALPASRAARLDPAQVLKSE